jgi:hypothetical protein
MLNRRIIFIVLAVLLVIGLVVVIIIKKRAPVLVPSQNAVNQGQASSTTQLPVVDQINPFPNEDRFDIGTPFGTISIKNIYPMVIDDNEGTLTLYEREGFYIAYEAASSRFDVSIKGNKFDEERPIAEQRFLNLLDISQTDACKLTVFVETQYNPDPALYRAPQKLSFCF